jgi:hypothetical protein
MNPRSIVSLKANRINVDALPGADKARIEQIGFWRWLDEAADRQLAQRKAGQVPAIKGPSRRYSLEYRQKQMRRRSNRAKIAS